MSQISLPTERDLIVARTVHFRDDGADMTIYIQDTPPILEYFGRLGENVRTL